MMSSDCEKDQSWCSCKIKVTERKLVKKLTIIQTKENESTKAF